jgi:hypothetical protein
VAPFYGKFMSAIEKQEYFEYLEMLRESGETNMFGASPYLQQAFGLSRYEAKDVLLEWMKTYKVPA